MFIFPAKDKDIPVVASLEKELYPHPWSEKDFKDILNQENFWFCVAKKSEEIVGYLVCQVVGEEAELHNIAVAKEHQKQGIAKDMLIKLVETLKQKNVTELYLMVRASNIAAKKLYEQFGFEKMGIRKNYYQSPEEDAFVYRFNFPLLR